jgi:hypothetical protein
MKQGHNSNGSSSGIVCGSTKLSLQTKSTRLHLEKEEKNVIEKTIEEIGLLN